MPADRPPGLNPRLFALGVLATAGLAVFLVLRRPEVALAIHLYAVAVGALLAGALAAAAVAGTVSEPGRWPLAGWFRRRRPAPERVRSLEELERAVDFAVTTAFDVHFRLRPHLVRIARHRLSAGRGILLEEDPEAARRLLGEAAWDLVRPDREPPARRNARGLPLSRLRAVVEALESL